MEYMWRPHLLLNLIFRNRVKLRSFCSDWIVAVKSHVLRDWVGRMSQ